ncbi:sensor histidine kinase [Streptomyces sp. SPB074]|uniref:sensor histidine kinase n=1 Tax=Streptomyces sp. (strain SPB074) TaxID=465543 RepID=UPI00017F1CEB|nr:sensor histidine kinase [Streptomyces sp. SPB074]EDY44121.2 two-component system sensor kinase [Streptomyces sp. SPB074]
MTAGTWYEKDGPVGERAGRVPGAHPRGAGTYPRGAGTYARGYDRDGWPLAPPSGGRPHAPGDGRTPLARALFAPVSPRFWRELLYLFVSLPLSLVAFVWAVVMFCLGAGLLITFIGVPVLALLLASMRGLAHVERGLARGLLGTEVAGAGPLRGGRHSLFGLMGALLKSGESWRHLLFAVLHFPWTAFAATLSLAVWSSGLTALTYPLWVWAVPGDVGHNGIQIYGDTHHAEYVDSGLEIALTCAAGLVLTLLAPWLVRGLTTVDALLVRALLGRSRLESRVGELESDRGVVVDTAAADLRRIERDLHDGAQARLVALAMDLGVAKEKLVEDPEAGARLVASAHGEVKTALQELRDLARGIHPAVLTDRGLDAALSSVAARCTVSVSVEVDLHDRPAEAIEGIAYFTVSELLQNVSKHSGARTATVEVWRAGDRLLLQVHDDGHGGASLDGGTGLAGLSDRLGAVDGVLLVDSPPGGPTTLTAELPWTARAARPGTGAATGAREGTAS